MVADMDLSFLVGLQVLQVSVGEHQSVLGLDEGASISIECEIELADRRVAPGVEMGHLLLSLLGRTISAVRSKESGDLEITFDDESVLCLCVSHDGYESFVIAGRDGTTVA